MGIDEVKLPIFPAVLTEGHPPPLSTLTQAIDEFAEVDEAISIFIKQTEKADSQRFWVGSVGPGEQQAEQALKLLHVYAVLLQVRQAGVMALGGIAAASPVTAGQVLGLERETEGYERPDFSYIEQLCNIKQGWACLGR